ncbi:hypothetical protein F5Y12DRAFT_713950 [Xylaria sp. FL1777]|nr:hypothetical protein F5Y12DRAFT_713950 [Xylaria sp. FL1777]
MSTTSYSTNDSRPTSRQYDTGFPDSFASCTTSMRHPDAIIDPGFAISAEHIDPAKTLHRSRMSLLRKHKRTISHGKIDEGTLGQNSLEKPPSRFSTADSATELVDQKSHVSSKAGAESVSQENGSQSIFQYAGNGDYDSDERRTNNIFRKLMNKT